MRHHAVAIFCIVFASFVAVNAFDAPRAKEVGPLTRFEFSEPHMGTTFRIVLYAADEVTAKKAAAAAFARVSELNRIMSDYLEDSELMQLCKKAGGPAVPVSDDLLAILKVSDEVSRASEGAFDVTVGPVVRLWRRSRRTRELPPPGELKKALALVNYRNVQIDVEAKTVRLLVADMLLDLGGIAKGYAAEAALAVLRRHGVVRALVAAGGDIAVADPPPEAKGWRVALEGPVSKDDKPPPVLLLANAAVSTAGDANQFVMIAGKRYSHIVDPRTGMGLMGRRAVNVIAPRGTLADAYDTAACVLGLEKGMKLIESHPDLAGRFVEVDNEGQVSCSTTTQFAGYARAGE